MAHKNPKDKGPEVRFAGMVVFLVETGVQTRRLQVWKQKLRQLGAEIEEHFSRRVTHIFAINSKALTDKIGHRQLKKLKRDALSYQWLEDCLKEGSKLPEEQYRLEIEFEDQSKLSSDSVARTSEGNDRNLSGGFNPRKTERTEASTDQFRVTSSKHNEEGQHSILGDEDTMKTSNADIGNLVGKEYYSDETWIQRGNSIEDTGFGGKGSDQSNSEALVSRSKNVAGLPGKELSLSYTPPDLNKNITEPFAKLYIIYKALGDERRSFSYYKALSVLEKIPFKIVSIDQVKGLPAIGQSMQDHIQEIIYTGRLAKLEHFEKDEKIRTMCLFGEVWGIGPATALKLYEKGHRTLEDLKGEDSLTTSQRIGLEFFDDIKQKIPRHEVQEMEALLQKAAEDILPGIVVVCGGSYRRGKAFCGDMDIIITHPDGKSHRGFLPKFVKHLKDVDFLKEDLLFSIHSIEGTGSGVDTYFGLCKNPNRQQRHRIDLKVYPSEIYAFGLVAWTGNDVLNRRLRLLAEAKGYKLDDKGIFPVTQTSTGKVAKASTSICCKTEKEVFDFLGFPYLEPHERNL